MQAGKEDVNALTSVLCSTVLRGLVNPMPAVVFDLDETLVYASVVKPAAECIDIKVGRRKVYVRVRPGVREMIKQVSEMFDVFFFTASEPQYANQIIDAIAPDTPVSHRFFRDSCKCQCGYSVKDLKLIGRPLNRVLIVDDIEGSAIMQPGNLVRIAPWLGDKDDDVITSKLCPMLMRIACEADLPSAFRNHAKENELSGLYTSACLA